METILLIAIAAFIIYLGFTLIKKAVSLAFTVVSVVGIILLIGGFFVVQDAIKFKNDFEESQNIFVLADNGTYYDAVVLDLNATDRIADYDVSDVETSLENENYNEEYFKYFIIERQAVENIEEDVNIGVGNVSAETLAEALYSDSPSEVLEREMNIPFGSEMVEMLGGEEELRKKLFGAALLNIIGEKNFGFIEEMRKENIIIRPKTLLFQTIDLIPMRVFEVNESAGQS